MNIGQGRPALLGRLRMADWVAMPEADFAVEVTRIETSPLFEALSLGRDGAPPVVLRQPWPDSRLSAAYHDRILRAAEASGLAAAVRRLGRPAFEQLVVHGDGAPLDALAARTGLEVAQLRDLRRFVAAHEARDVAAAEGCLARLAIENARLVLEFESARWARGLYEVRHDRLAAWKESGLLPPTGARGLQRLLKRLETVNLRQSAIFRIVEAASRLQLEYLSTGDERLRSPVSLRRFAERLGLSASTVSRALSGRFVNVPWGARLPMIALVPGRRSVLRGIMAGWLEEQAGATDAALAERFRCDYGILVSRRTVNAVRHALKDGLADPLLISRER